MGNIGAPEIIVVLVLALLIFGPNRLPQLGRQIGRAMREFRQATSDLKADFDLALDEDDEPERPAAAGAPAALEAGSAADTPTDGTADAGTADGANPRPDLSGFAETLPPAIVTTEGAAEPVTAGPDAAAVADLGSTELTLRPEAESAPAGAVEPVPADGETTPPTTDGGS